MKLNCKEFLKPKKAQPSSLQWRGFLKQNDMTTVNKTSQHGDITVIDGSRKKVIQALRVEAREKRLESRKRHNLPLNVGSINSNLHQSNLVTMASYQLENLGLYALISLLNKHGITEYKEV